MKTSFGAISGFALAGAILTLVPTGGAAAQTYPCAAGPGPGERQVGATEAGNGMASIPLCEADGSVNSSGPGPAPFSAAEWGNSISAAMRQYAADLRAYQEAKGKLEADPRYQRYMRGAWHILQAGNGSTPGDRCTAIWTGQGVMLMISKWPTDATGLFTFWGPDIPKPKRAGYVTATIKQSDGTVQKIKAVNYGASGMEAGSLTLEVPSFEGAIEDIKDVFRIELLVNGKNVVTADWRDGSIARKKMQACVARRTAS